MKPRLLIASPAYNGDIKSAYVGSLMNTMFGIMRDGLVKEFHLLTYDRESLIPRARNKSAMHLLETEYEKLLFIDADMTFTYESVKALVSSDKPIIGGTYPLKTYPLKLNFNPLIEHVGSQEDPRRWQEFDQYRKKYSDINGEVEVRHVPTGFMMIDRTVFETMIDKGAPKYTEWDDVAGKAQKYYDFFQTGVHNGLYESEDWFFCRRANELGYRVYLNTNIVNGHIGVHHYEVKF